MSVRPRLWSAKLVTLGAFISLVLIYYTYSTSEFSFRLSGWSSVFSGRRRSTCLPEAWADGQWAYSPRTNLSSIKSTQDALAMGGLQGCAADREYTWHLGTDHEDEWGRFPSVNSYQWVPSNQCRISPLNGASIVKHMVEKGGWLLLGGMFPFLYHQRPGVHTLQIQSRNSTSFPCRVSSTPTSVQHPTTLKTHTLTVPGFKTYTYPRRHPYWPS